MLDLRVVMGEVAGAVSLLGFVPYLVETVRGTTRPNRATWFIWTVVGTMLCASYFAAGGRDAIWVPVMYAVGPAVIALVSLRHGEGGWTRFDRLCLAGAGGSLGLWWLSGSPVVALATNVLIDLLGALPTLRKALRDPAGESRTSWTLFCIGNLLNLGALHSLSLAEVAYPVYLAVLTGAMMCLLWRPRRAPATAAY